MPWAPVSAFALPAFTTTAWMCAGSRLRVWITDADGSALAVSTRADVTRRVLVSTPTSSPPDSFSPAATPLAANPDGVVTPPAARRSSSAGNPIQSSRITRIPLSAVPRPPAAPP